MIKYWIIANMIVLLIKMLCNFTYYAKEGRAYGLIDLILHGSLFFWGLSIDWSM